MIQDNKIYNGRLLALNNNLGELYTPEEIAEYFKVHLVTVYNWVKTKKLIVTFSQKEREKLLFDLILSRLNDLRNYET